MKTLIDYLEYFSLPFLFYIGYLTAFGDMKSGRIPNKLIWLGVKLGVIWHLFYIGVIMWVFKDELLTNGQRNIVNYILEFGVNTTLGLVVAFFMWWMRQWAAGDAKLFVVFTFLLPVDFYEKFHVKWFPAFAFLYNVFICALAFILFEFVYKLLAGAAKSRRSGDMREFIDKNLNRKAVRAYLIGSWRPGLRLLLGLIFSFLITSLIRKYLGVAVEKILPWKFTINLQHAEINESIIFLLIFLLFQPLAKLYQNLVFYYVTVFSLVGYVFLDVVRTGSVKSLTDLLHFGGLSILMIVFRKVFEFYSDKINKSIPLESLETKTVLSRKALGKIAAEDPEFYKANFELVYPDGLTEEQVTALKGWKKIDPIEISETFHFALFIAAGVAVTIIFRGIFPIFLGK